MVREVGIRLTGLENFGFIYKRGIGEDVYRRYRLFSSSVTYLNTNAGSQGNLGVGAAIGKERRSPLTDRLQFARGPEFSLSLSALFAASQTVVNITPGFGYVLGLVYTINPQFHVSAEVIPSVSVLITTGNLDVVGFSAGLNSNSVALTAAYRFFK